ncbi:MAG: MATE family efflux transporter, partial [Pyramidobacter sp.]|nr:MATE family efflux transporter [Pyramidobacter sp.]
RLSLRCLRPQLQNVREMLGVGLSPFLLNIFFSVMLALFNVLLGSHGGELAVSAMGIFFGIDSLLFMPVTGIGEGTMPVVGYNYGAHSFARVRQAVRLALAASIAWYTVSEVVAFVWPETLASFFTTDAELLRQTARSMRIGYAALPLGAVAVIGCYVLEALGRAKTSFTFNVFRQSLSIALLIVLPRFLGTDGVWLTLPAADVIGGASMAFLLHRESQTWV